MKTNNKARGAALNVSRVGWTLIAACWLLSVLEATCGQAGPGTFEAYLRGSVVDRKTLEVFLDPKQLSWAKFDPVAAQPATANVSPTIAVSRLKAEFMATA